MSKFVMVTDNTGCRYAINVDRILWLSPDTRCVCMSEGDVMMTLHPEDIQRLLDMMGVDGHDTD